MTYKHFKSADAKENDFGSIVVQNLLDDPEYLNLSVAKVKIVGEQKLLKSGQNIQADLLKVGHHGSDTATGADFLAKVSPANAVIQVGQDNKFGLPDLRVINLLTRLGVAILRNDLQGDIIFTFKEGQVILN